MDEQLSGRCQIVLGDNVVGDGYCSLALSRADSDALPGLDGEGPTPASRHVLYGTIDIASLNVRVSVLHGVRVELHLYSGQIVRNAQLSIALRFQKQFAVLSGTIE